MRKKTLPDIPPADLYWLAGLLEGEGSFLKPPPSSPASPRVAVEMTDRDVVERVGRVLGAIAQPMPDRNNPRWKPTYRALIGGERAADLMRLLHPLMGLRRQAQISAALDARTVAIKATVPAMRLSRNIEIAQRLADGESGTALAREFEVTHQNIYYIGKKYKDKVACPSG
jgi:hypothetical protein